MAIKDRLLKSLKSAYDIMNTVANSHPQKMHPVLLELVKAQKLCQKGLPEKDFQKYGEVYDGLIMAIRQIFSGDAGKDAREIVNLCKELLEHIVIDTTKEEHFKREIVFLPYKASMWDSMESVWQAAVDDTEHAVPYVVVIPYCDRDTDGGPREWHCEAAEFPEYVPVVDFRNVDLKTMHPDVIVIQNPYDDYNTVTSVDMRYYSRYLKEYTDKLVYIPYFVLEEPDLDDEEALEDIADFLFHGEAVRNANLTIVQSENMREAYIRLLVKYSNKDRAFWQKRILGIGSPKIDKVLSTRREDVQLPESWRRIIERPDGTRKKVILYNVSLPSLLEYEEKLFDKMDWVFKTFSEQQDKVVLLWRPHPLFEATIKSQVPKLWDRYRKMIERYQDEGGKIYDDSPDLHRALRCADAYYGDMSSLVVLCQLTGKNVILQDIKRETIGEKLTKCYGAEFTDAVVEGDTIWFLDLNTYNHVKLFQYNMFDETLHYLGNLPEKCSEWSRRSHRSMIKYENIIYIFPWGGEWLIKYDVEYKIFKKITKITLNKYNNAIRGLQKNLIIESFLYENKIYAISMQGTIICYDTTTDKFTYYRDWYEALLEKNKIDTSSELYWIGSLQQGNLLYIPIMQKNIIVEFDFKNGTSKLHYVSSSKHRYSGIDFDGKFYWLLDDYNNQIVCWDKDKSYSIEYPLEKKLYSKLLYSGIKCISDKCVMIFSCDEKSSMPSVQWFYPKIGAIGSCPWDEGYSINDASQFYCVKKFDSRSIVFSLGDQIIFDIDNITGDVKSYPLSKDQLRTLTLIRLKDSEDYYRRENQFPNGVIDAINWMLQSLGDPLQKKEREELCGSEIYRYIQEN